ncbi:hypothetical protein [Psychrobacillus sp. BM2]|uniref:hypothetical protein n=1 Tax=Psychrobacillus sp. BM2 TaxID=3400421 RepID=UPI003B01C88B
MNKTYYDTNKIYKEDFAMYLNFVNSRAQNYCVNVNTFQGQLKNLYKQVFSLMTIHSKTLSNSDVHLKEAILNLPIALDLLFTNNVNAFRLMSRNIIEQFNRYLYSKVTNGETDTIRHMHKFLKMHYKKFKIKKYIEILTSEYKNLCEYVHVTKQGYFSTENNLSDYYFNPSQDKNIKTSIKLFNNILQSIMIILISEETSNYLTLTRDDQILVESCITVDLNMYVIIENYYIRRNPTFI